MLRSTPYESQCMREHRKIIREAIAVAIEGLNGTAEEWLLAHGNQKKALHKHVVEWVHDFAKNRGVELSNIDIESELSNIVTELRASLKKEADLIDTNPYGTTCSRTQIIP